MPLIKHVCGGHCARGIERMPFGERVREVIRISSTLLPRAAVEPDVHFV